MLCYLQSHTLDLQTERIKVMENETYPAILENCMIIKIEENIRYQNREYYHK